MHEAIADRRTGDVTRCIAMHEADPVGDTKLGGPREPHR
jgi:hypothetical protein